MEPVQSRGMSAGYSGTPLIRKLGLKPGMRCRFVGAPDHYLGLLGKVPDDVVIARTTRGTFDFIHLFTRRRADLLQLAKLRDHLDASGMLWASWAKKSSPLAGEVDEAAVRQAGLDTGLVDVKICAVDDDWSALKFVYRRQDR